MSDAAARWIASRHGTPPSSWLHRRKIAATIGNWRDPATLGCGVDLDFQRRVALAGFACHDAARISVLKFPSAWWRNYAPGQIHPQPEYLRRIETAPETLERDLLQALVVRHARDENGARPLLELRRAVTALPRRRRWLRPRPLADVGIHVLAAAAI